MAAVEESLRWTERVERNSTAESENVSRIQNRLEGILLEQIPGYLCQFYGSGLGLQTGFELRSNSRKCFSVFFKA
jgi:hypothetical protein